MSLFPIKSTLGDIEWTIDRHTDDTFMLTCVTAGQSVSIEFPVIMVVNMAHRIVEVSNRMEADMKTARSFRRSAPYWPLDIFDEESK